MCCVAKEAEYMAAVGAREQDLRAKEHDLQDLHSLLQTAHDGYVCMYVCTYIRTYVHTYIRMDIHYVCSTYVWIYITYAHTYCFLISPPNTYVCMYVCMYVYTYVCMYVYIYIHILYIILHACSASLVSLLYA